MACHKRNSALFLRYWKYFLMRINANKAGSLTSFLCSKNTRYFSLIHSLEMTDRFNKLITSLMIKMLTEICNFKPAFISTPNYQYYAKH